MILNFNLKGFYMKFLSIVPGFSKDQIFWCKLFFVPIFLICISSSASAQDMSRWYSNSDVKAGRLLFKQKCANCHGEYAQGLVKNWKKKVNGHYPAPPLNGTAHAWHHSMNLLERTIIRGGVPLGGVMPAFNNSLSPKERKQIISYFQSFWPDETYKIWIERGGLN